MTVLYTPHKACCINFDPIQEIEPKVGVGTLSQMGVLSLDYNKYCIYTYISFMIHYSQQNSNL